MSEHIYVFTVLLIAGTCVLVFGMRFLTSFQDARSRTAKADAYRELAATAAAVQSEAVTRLAGIQSELSSVGARLTAIEKTLSEVG